MPTVLERLRRALQPEYEIEREIASGGMGMVFLARDMALGRRVAIKIVRPEMATAHATERFLREARILASLNHTNLMSVHRAGEADGLPYYVMDFYDGDTLAGRLARGPLSVGETRQLGLDLLSALAAAHRNNVVHRDIKPANVFLVGDRAVLADFGIAKVSSQSAVTEPGVAPGTPGYMAPEQMLGGKVTPRTDIYAIGLVLYEAVTGHAMRRSQPGQPIDWKGVPRELLPALKRALAWEADDRWRSATEFRDALAGTAGGPRLARAVVLTGLALAVVIAVALQRWNGTPQALPPASLAILSFIADDGDDADPARWLARLAHSSIDTAITLVPTSTSLDWAPPRGTPPESTAVAAAKALSAHNVATGAVHRRGDTLVVDLAVTDAAGTVRPARVAGSGGDLPTLGYQIGLQLVRTVDPSRVPAFPTTPPIISSKSEAIIEYLRGDDAFHENRWQTAVAHFSHALALDSTFVPAASGLFNAYRWLNTGEAHPPGLDLAAVRASYQGNLTELDRLILDAQLEPSAQRRFALYQTATEKYPRSGYVALQYGEELLHRGPFLGFSWDTAGAVLGAALEKDSTLAPALDHLIWTDLRLGRRDDARRHLDRLKRLVPGPEETQLYTPALYELVFAERFAPGDSVLALRAWFLTDPQLREGLALTLRLGLGFGLPKTQAELAQQLLRTDSWLEARSRGSVYVGRGVALVALGRVADALASMDTAASLLGSPEAHFQAAEWRIIAPALGVPGFDPEQRAAGRALLRSFVDDPERGVRAKWALGVDAARSGDTLSAGRWLQALRRGPDDSVTSNLAWLLESLVEAAAGNDFPALQFSQRLLTTDSSARGGDPFARAVLHMTRAEAFDSLDLALTADSVRLWYEHFDVVAFPAGAAQAAEIDWALGSYARWLRGDAAIRRGDHRAACSHLEPVIELWRAADEAYHQLRARAERFVSRSCRR